MGASPRNGAPVVGIAAVTGLNQPLCGLVPTGNSAVDAVGIVRRTGFQHTSTWRMERTTKRQNIEADKKLRKQGLAKENRRSKPNETVGTRVLDKRLSMGREILGGF